MSSQTTSESLCPLFVHQDSNTDASSPFAEYLIATCTFVEMDPLCHSQDYSTIQNLTLPEPR